MDTMNLLDITIKYFHVIIFVLCVLFGMTSFFASWVAWREIHRKRNIIRSVIAAYHIAEDTIDKGRTAEGELHLEPQIVETVFNSLQEILNAIHGEVTGKPIPAREERVPGASRNAASRGTSRLWRRSGDAKDTLNIEKEVPSLIPDTREYHNDSPRS
ncbi:MAG: hypothetical protein AB1646_04420 [Thermodesulfobacteriota bacterium]